jgi:hypothetical protein
MVSSGLRLVCVFVRTGADALEQFRQLLEVRTADRLHGVAQA